jgi:hypothetical protein
VGVLREGQVYELFYTSLPQEAFLPSDVLDLYFQRGGFESSLADEDQEEDADRWCSGTPWGQECWQILAQWVWNLRLELSQRAWPTQLRTTQLAQALTPETTTMEASPTTLEVHVFQASTPELTGHWARAARPGLFAGKDFVPQENGTLRSPAGQPLWERERRPQADGSLRSYYAARRSSCQTCALRAQCRRAEPTQVLGAHGQCAGRQDPGAPQSCCRPARRACPRRDPAAPVAGLGTAGGAASVDGVAAQPTGDDQSLADSTPGSVQGESDALAGPAGASASLVDRAAEPPCGQG